MVHSNLRRNEVMSSAPMIFQEFMRSGNSRLGPQLEWKYRSPRVPGQIPCFDFTFVLIITCT